MTTFTPTGKFSSVFNYSKPSLNEYCAVCGFRNGTHSAIDNRCLLIYPVNTKVMGPSYVHISKDPLYNGKKLVKAPRTKQFSLTAKRMK